MRSEWIHSQGFYFESQVGSEVRIFGIYNNKKQIKGDGGDLRRPPVW